MIKKLTIVLCVTAVFSSGSIVMAQTCKTNITISHPKGQFLLNSDGTVTDVKNGLMWSLCSVGQDFKDGTCEGTPTHYPSWREALESASHNATFAGYNDWRLPNIKELGDLIERSCVSPAIDLSYFPATPSAAYWSNTMDSRGVNSSLKGMVVDFTDGASFLPDVNRHRMIRMIRELD